MGRPITHGHYRRGRQSATHKSWESMLCRCAKNGNYWSSLHTRDEAKARDVYERIAKTLAEWNAESR